MVDSGGAPPSAPAHAHNKISDGAASTVGLQRHNNQDAHSRPPAGANLAAFGSLFVLADGVAGRPDGEQASWTAVHFLQALYYRPGGPAQPADRLRAAVESVNVLNRAVMPAPSLASVDSQPLTTLVAAVIHNERLWVANVGDSRAYLVRARQRQAAPLTEDHSQVLAPPAPEWPPAHDPGATLRSPALARERAAPRRALTRAIGLDEHCQVDIYTYTWEEGDRLILCSDGLDDVPEPALVEAVLDRSAAEGAERLVAEAVTRGSGDNATAVVVARHGRSSGSRRRTRGSQHSWGQLILLTLVAVAFGVALGLLAAFLLSLYMTGGLA
jgi:PPM family protein phosphatase